MVERGGQAVVKVVPDVKAKTLLPMILEHVPAGQTVYTDEMFSYNRLSSLGYMHRYGQALGQAVRRRTGAHQRYRRNAEQRQAGN